jgi:exopolyphosphatase/guanosine-5'-triphosphate,3'-diphosphate pyrophosphatase
VRATEFSSHGGGLSPGPVAAVDCGTNSTRLLVVAETGTALERLIRITRLGEGVDAGRRLRPEAVERTLSTLRDYRGIMDDTGVVRARVVATSAVRDAVNGDEFLRDVAHVMGVRPELLSGDEEGLLSYQGATADLPAGEASKGSVLVVDIGGGSTEFAVGPPPVVTHSLDIGCVRLTERFLSHDPPRPDEVATARAYVSAQVAAARDALPELPPDPLLVGLAGTVSTLAFLSGGLTEYDRARVHHAILERAAVERWASVLASENALTRLGRPGIVQGREDVIVGGVLILAVVMEVFACQRCLVSEDDILDGLALTLLPASEDAG